jgi:hypothetical protein
VTPGRVHVLAPRETAPRLLRVLALAALATACLLAGGVTYQVTYLRGADISRAALLLRSVGSDRRIGSADRRSLGDAGAGSATHGTRPAVSCRRLLPDDAPDRLARENGRLRKLVEEITLKMASLKSKMSSYSYF